MKNLLAYVTFAIIACAALVADARPGGGSTYHSSGGGSYHSSGGSYHSSGGSYHSSSSGGYTSSGGGYSSTGNYGSLDPVFVLIFVVVLALILIIGAIAKANSPSWDSLDSFDPGGSFEPEPAPPPSPAGIYKTDPDFSLAVFEDFAFELYAAAHRAAHDPAKLATLAPYLTSVAASHLAAREREPVSQVVVGSLRIESITTANVVTDLAQALAAAPPSQVEQRITVRFESNLAFGSGTLACVERWQFTRVAGVRSRAPDRTHTWPCPNCGAPWATKDNPRTCASCGQTISAGRFDWTVDQIWVVSTDSVGQTLTGTVEEQGTQLDTIVTPGTPAKLASLTADDPNITMDAVSARVRMIYAQLNSAWNGMELSPVRGLVTRSMLDYLRFWIDEYKRQHLSNRLDGGVVHDVVLAKVVRDHQYDALTVRVYANGFDYTVDASGQIVGGSKTDRRMYTEYWTLLRSSARKGPVGAKPACPNCGAPLAISDRGACEHCNAEVDSGNFDFVLSKIEQDESYIG